MSLFDQTFTENKVFYTLVYRVFSVTSHNNPHSTKDAMTDGKNAYLDSRGVMRAESKQKLHFRLIAVISQNDS